MSGNPIPNDVAALARETAAVWDRMDWSQYEGNWFEDMAEDIGRAILADRHSRPDTSGYTNAFYAVAEVMGIGAQAASPKDVFESTMLPKLREAMAALAELERFRSERSYVIGFNDGFAQASSDEPA